MNKDLKRVRDHSTDFFKCLLMIMILIHHSIVHGLNLSGLTNGTEVNPICKSFIFILNSFCVVAVNCYFFLSGFYQIKYSLKKILHLYIECSFYALIWAVIELIAKQTSVRSISFIKNAFFVFFPVRCYWFMAVYFLLCFLSPYIKKFMADLNFIQQRNFIIIITFINVVYGFIFNWVGIGTGHTFMEGLYLYFLGIFCSNNLLSIRKKMKRTYLLGGYIGISFLIGIISYILYHFGHQNSFAWRMYNYNNPFIVISSMCLALTFIKMNHQPRLIIAVSRLSRLSLAAYLLTDHTSARKYLFVPLVHFLEYVNSSLIQLIGIIGYAIICFIICIGIEFIRQKLFRFIGKLIHLEEKYEIFCNRHQWATRL